MNTEENNIIQIGDRTIIINGGNALEGCPKDWDEARLIEQRLNEGKDEEDSQPLWSFDCGFKLDFDGPLVRVNSRFYPPKTDYGPTWDGTVSVYLLNMEVIEKKFDCKTLDELKKEAEDFVDGIRKRLANCLTHIS